MKEVKLCIIGAGPAGIAGGIEAKANKIEPVVILEKAPHVCNTIEKYYKPGKRVDAEYRGLESKPLGICSFETETKEDFLKRIYKWIEEWKLDIHLNSEVTGIKKINKKYEIYVKGDPKFQTDFVIIAIGIFGRPRKPSYPIPKEIKDKVFFEPPLEYPEAEKVLVVGGGNTAAEVACFLCEKAKVFMSYRRPQFFRINPTNLEILENKVKENKITLLLNTDIEKVEPYNNKVKVYYKDGKEDIYDYIFYCLGGTSPRKFLESVGIEFDEEGNPKIDEFYETNLPGVFLAGDIAVKKGNIMSAFNTAHIVIKRIKEKYLK